jgi:hypothetical protein
MEWYRYHPNYALERIRGKPEFPYKLEEFRKELPRLRQQVIIHLPG